MTPTLFRFTDYENLVDADSQEISAQMRTGAVLGIPFFTLYECRLSILTPRDCLLGKRSYRLALRFRAASIFLVLSQPMLQDFDSREEVVTLEHQ